MHKNPGGPSLSKASCISQITLSSCISCSCQVGLIDNQVEFTDVLSAYARHLSNKRSRMPPSVISSLQHDLSTTREGIPSAQGRGGAAAEDGSGTGFKFSAASLWNRDSTQGLRASSVGSGVEGGGRLSPTRLRVIDAAYLEGLWRKEQESLNPVTASNAVQEGLSGAEMLGLLLELMGERYVSMCRLLC